MKIKAVIPTIILTAICICAFTFGFALVDVNVAWADGAVLEETVHQHAPCGEVCEHSGHTTETYVEVPQSMIDSMPVVDGTAEAQDGYWVLTEDLIASANLNIAGKVNLCLNGFSVNMASYTVTVANGAELNICNCAGDTASIFANSLTGTTLFVNKGTFNMYGGVISGAECGLRNYGTFNMYGGSFTGSVYGIINDYYFDEVADDYVDGKVLLDGSVEIYDNFDELNKVGADLTSYAEMVTIGENFSTDNIINFAFTEGVGLPYWEDESTVAIIGGAEHAEKFNCPSGAGDYNNYLMRGTEDGNIAVYVGIEVSFIDANSIQSKYCVLGDEISKPADPEAKGESVFLGWSKDVAGYTYTAEDIETIDWTTPITVGESGNNFYAVWRHLEHNFVDGFCTSCPAHKCGDVIYDRVVSMVGTSTLLINGARPYMVSGFWNVGGGNMYLSQDVELDTTVCFEEDFNLCLNGHTLKVRSFSVGGSTAVTGNVLDCGEGGNITVADVTDPTFGQIEMYGRDVVSFTDVTLNSKLTVIVRDSEKGSLTLNGATCTGSIELVVRGSSGYTFTQGDVVATFDNTSDVSGLTATVYLDDVVQTDWTIKAKDGSFILDHVTHTDADADYLCDLCAKLTLEGSGTQSDPYVVYDATQLVLASNSTENQVNHIKFACDITLSDDLYDPRKSVFIDLNTYKFSTPDGGILLQRNPATITNGSLDVAYVQIRQEVTISNVVANLFDGAITIWDGKVIINNVDIIADDVSGREYKALDVNGGIVTVNDVTISCKYGVYSVYYGTMTLDGASVSGTNTETSYHTHKDEDGDCVCDREGDVCHNGTISNFNSFDDGTHDEYWSCCNKLANEYVTCTISNRDTDCTTNELCACGYTVEYGNFSHNLLLTSIDGTNHSEKCQNDGCTYEVEVPHEAIFDGICTTADLCECGHSMTVPHTQHNFVDGYCTNEDCYAHKCGDEIFEYAISLQNGDYYVNGVMVHMASGLLFLRNGNYYLTADLGFGSLRLSLSNNSQLCLNGHNLNLVTIYTSEGEYSIQNCKESGEVTFISEHTTEFQIDPGTTFTLKNVMLSGAISIYSDSTAMGMLNLIGTSGQMVISSDQESQDLVFVKYDSTSDVSAITYSNADWGFASEERADGYVLKLNHLAHTGGTAYCVKLAECETCGQEYGDYVADSHSSDTTKWHSVANDTTRHYRHCAYCDATLMTISANHTVVSNSFTTRSELKRVMYGYAYILYFGFTCEECGVLEFESGEIYTDGMDLNEFLVKTTPATCSTYAKYNYISDRPVVNDSVSFTWELLGVEFDSNNHTITSHHFEHSGESVHNKICNDCGGVAEENLLCSGGTAYCQQKAICVDCQSEHGDFDPNSHIADESKWGSQGAGKHYRTCSLCSTALEAGSGFHNVVEDSVYTRYENYYSVSDGSLKGYVLLFGFDCVDCGHVEIRDSQILFEYLDIYTEQPATCNSYATYLIGNVQRTIGENSVCLDWELVGVEFDSSNHALSTIHHVSNGNHTHKEVYDCCNVTVEGRESIPCTPVEDDNDCTTAVACTICGGEAVSALNHTYTNNCDTVCNNVGCDHAREITHSPSADDGDCTTAILCSICSEVTTPGATSHRFSEDYVGDAHGHYHKCENCNVTDTKQNHNPETGVTDCTVDVKCVDCEYVVKERSDSHVFTNSCDTTCDNLGCEHTREIDHLYDNDCDTSCNACGAVRDIVHAFDNACDSECNVCGESREITHVYNEDHLCEVCRQADPSAPVGLSGGAIAGIVVGCAVAVAGGVVAVLWFVRKRKKA